MSHVTLTLQPDRRLFRIRRSRRYLVATLTAEDDASPARRPGQRVAIVVDTSAAMAPFASDIAKAVGRLLDTLTDRDEIAFITFSHDAQVVQARTLASPEVTRRIQSAARRLTFRGESGLRRGWLTGCHEIAETSPRQTPVPSHCWVISEGTDEKGSALANTARDVLERTAIATSVISANPRMAAISKLGGGALHPLRGLRRLPPSDRILDPTPIEIEAPGSVLVEVLGPYHTTPVGTNRWRIHVSDLCAGETRHIVIRLAFHDYEAGGQARILVAFGDETYTLRYRCAPHAECDREPKDPEVRGLIAVPRAENLWRLAREYEKALHPQKACAEIEYAQRILRQSPDAPGAHDMLDDLELERQRLMRETP